MASATRQAVVAEAMSWAGTPYHHHARVKGAGVDCAQLPAAVYEAVGLIPHVEPEYVHDWHLHRGEELYVGWVLRFAREIEPAAGRGGDFALWKWGRTFSHGGILLDEVRVIHSFISIGVSVDRRDQHEELKQRPCRMFTMWDD